MRLFSATTITNTVLPSDLHTGCTHHRCPAKPNDHGLKLLFGQLMVSLHVTVLTTVCVCAFMLQRVEPLSVCVPLCYREWSHCLCVCLYVTESATMVDKENFAFLTCSVVNIAINKNDIKPVKYQFPCAYITIGRSHNALHHHLWCHH